MNYVLPVFVLWRFCGGFVFVLRWSYVRLVKVLRSSCEGLVICLFPYMPIPLVCLFPLCGVSGRVHGLPVPLPRNGRSTPFVRFAAHINAFTALSRTRDGREYGDISFVAKGTGNEEMPAGRDAGGKICQKRRMRISGATRYFVDRMKRSHCARKYVTSTR